MITGVSSVGISRLAAIVSFSTIAASAALAQVDTDGDGLDDSTELELATFPNLADSDRDNLSDGIEVNVEGTDPLNVDTDGDGLTDSEEVQRFFTDPTRADSDGDGVADFLELTVGTDPLNSNSVSAAGQDFDFDGVGTFFEDALGIHPYQPDSDGGGQLDGFEILNGLDPQNFTDDFVDTDGDGVVDEYERLIGLDPNNANDGGSIANYLFFLPDDTLMDADRDSIPTGSDQAGEFLADVNPFLSDTDGDGLSDGVEALPFELTETIMSYFEIPDSYLIRHATDPTKADTDDDGLNDSDELRLQHTDPLDPDTDDGGVTDGTEIEIGLDPLNGDDDDFEDADSDGLPDWMEGEYRSDPLNPDTDNDGLLDGAEVFVYRTSPSDADTDHGGIPDGAEVAAGGNPLDPADDGGDVIPPQFGSLDWLTVWAPEGVPVQVYYELPVATDNIDPDPFVSCFPVSGSTFGIGDTEVMCTAVDDAGNTGFGSFLVSVKEPHPPVAENQIVSTDEDTSVEFVLSASDADGDVLQYGILAYPGVGSIQGVAPFLEYVPPTNYFGTVSLTFIALDPLSYSSTATVTIHILPVNDLPTAVDDVAVVLEDSDLTFIDVLNNDSDIEEGELIVISASTPAGGVASVSSSGNGINYSPNLDFVGTDVFSYVMSDAQGGQSSATVTVTVLADTDGDGIPNSEDPDDDNDGIEDNIDLLPLEVSAEFDDRPLGGVTFGTIINFSAESPYRVAKISSFSGVVISDVSVGGAAALVTLCGGRSEYYLAPGIRSGLYATCGSEIVEVTQGQVDATLYPDFGQQIFLTIPAGFGIEFEPSTGEIDALGQNPSPLLAVVGNNTVSIEAGQQLQPADVVVLQQSINLASNGVIPLAILGTDDFDASLVIPESITLNGSGVKMVGNGQRSQCQIGDDVNDDGIPDLRCGILVSEWDESFGASLAFMTALTYDGSRIYGTAPVSIVY